jgi:hypothetical protein
MGDQRFATPNDPRWSTGISRCKRYSLLEVLKTPLHNHNPVNQNAALKRIASACPNLP